MEHIASTASRSDKLPQEIHLPAARIPLGWILLRILPCHKAFTPFLVLRLARLHLPCNFFDISAVSQIEKWFHNAVYYNICRLFFCHLVLSGVMLNPRNDFL